MDVHMSNFWAQRVDKELKAKTHFDKVVLIHQHIDNAKQKQQASRPGSSEGFTQKSGTPGNHHNVIRTKSYFNHVNRGKNPYLKKPDYFVATSTGIVPSDPNSLRDMGGSRNVPYTYVDITDDGHAGHVTWKDLASQEKTLRKINQQPANLM